ncbi:25288_t:CDS:2, partial [Racocetra persica]
KKNSSAQTSGKNDSPTDNSNLLQTKAETITSLKLDLKDYINEANTPEQLKERKGNTKAVISKLKKSPGPSGPIP